MKKLLLSALVIGLFIFNGLSKREDQTNSGAPSSITNQSNNNTQSAGLQPSVTTINSSTQAPSPTQSNTQTAQGRYKDGSYTGSVADAYYGNVQVQVTISGGNMSAVNFLQYPNDRNTSIMINSQAMPYLTQEAILAQSANVNIVSGASDTSQAFIQSLSSALAQAQ